METIDMQALAAIARRAGDEIMAVYATDFDVEWKAPEDPVTAADRDANALIVDALTREFRDDAVCAEEGDEAEAAAAAARGGRCWFVDPMDGTRDFVRRSGEFCVMIGLAIDGVARVGAVYAPVLGRMWSGVVGEGAWEHRDDGSARALTLDGEASSVFVMSRSRPQPAVVALAETLGASELRRCGSVGLKVGLVASGEAALYAHVEAGPKLWDACAPDAIAHGAGAVMTDATGRAIRYDTSTLRLERGIFAAHPRIAARALDALRG